MLEADNVVNAALPGAVPPMAGGDAKYAEKPDPETVLEAERVVNAPVLGVVDPIVPGAAQLITKLFRRPPESCGTSVPVFPNVAKAAVPKAVPLDFVTTIAPVDVVIVASPDIVKAPQIPALL